MHQDSSLRRLVSLHASLEQLECRRMMAADMGPHLLPLDGSASSLNLSAHYASQIAGQAPTISASATPISTNQTVPTAVLQSGYLKINGTDEDATRDSVIVRPSPIANKVEVALRKTDLSGNILYDNVLTFSTFSMPYGIQFKGYRGHDTFSNLTAIRSRIDGGLGDDTIFGGSGVDEIDGGEGNNFIVGNAGDDIIRGGFGEDSIYGGPGADRIWGRLGSDIIYGGSGNDSIYGEGGLDKLYGEAGDDVISGGDDRDELWGGAGHDTLYGDHGSDVLYGDDIARKTSGGGNDIMYGGAGNDRMEGHSGNDTMYGGIGEDYMEGQAGHDVMHGGDDRDFMSGGTGNDRMYGNNGKDRLGGDEGDDWLDGGYDLFSDALLGYDGYDTFVRHKSLTGGPGGGPEVHLDKPEKIDTDWHF